MADMPTFRDAVADEGWLLLHEVAKASTAFTFALLAADSVEDDFVVADMLGHLQSALADFNQYSQRVGGNPN